MSENRFSRVMSENTTEQLVEIVKKYKDDYQPEAVDAAKYELTRRGVDYAQYVLKEDSQLSNPADATMFLKVLVGILAFTFPVIVSIIGRVILSLFMPVQFIVFITLPLTVLLQIMIYIKLVRSNNYSTEAKIFKRWSIIGYVSLIVLAILSFFLIRALIGTGYM